MVADLAGLSKPDLPSCSCSPFCESCERKRKLAERKTREKPYLDGCDRTKRRKKAARVEGIESLEEARDVVERVARDYPEVREITSNSCTNLRFMVLVRDLRLSCLLFHLPPRSSGKPRPLCCPPTPGNHSSHITPTSPPRITPSSPPLLYIPLVFSSLFPHLLISLVWPPLLHATTSFPPHLLLNSSSPLPLQAQPGVQLCLHTSPGRPAGWGALHAPGQDGDRRPVRAR